MGASAGPGQDVGARLRTGVGSRRSGGGANRGFMTAVQAKSDHTRKRRIARTFSPRQLITHKTLVVVSAQKLDGRVLRQ